MAEKAKRNSFFQRFVQKWQENPLYSTGLVLILMILVQTIALGFDFPSFGDWFANWGKTGSTSCAITRRWAWWPWA